MSTQPIDPAEERNSRLAQQIDDISSQLATVAVTDNARLSERHFTQIFLPFFAGDKTLMYPVDMTHWLNTAGGPYREVEVIDLTGTVLFTVPPIFDRAAINATSDGKPIAHVVATATQYARIHPIQGQAYLSAELTQRALVMKVPSAVMYHLEVWNKIFQRYGRPPLISVDEPEPDKNNTAKDTINDDDYANL
jgi:hypothetical protein